MIKKIAFFIIVLTVHANATEVRFRNFMSQTVSIKDSTPGQTNQWDCLRDQESQFTLKSGTTYRFSVPNTYSTVTSTLGGTDQDLVTITARQRSGPSVMVVDIEVGDGYVAFFIRGFSLGTLIFGTRLLWRIMAIAGNDITHI